jgi:Uma2 family endonuclease
MTVAVSEIPRTPLRQYTPDDVLSMSDRIVELVDGQLVEKNLGTESSWIVTSFYRVLFPFTEAKGLGYLVVESFVRAFPEDPDRLRRPDLLFAAMHHFPGGVIPRGPLQFVPELIVEVQSPHDNLEQVEARIADHVSHGAKLVWLVLPSLRLVRVYRADGSVEHIREDALLSGEAVIPEFSVRVGELLPKRPG